VANAVSDDDLIGMLDSRYWLARSGSVALGLPGTLRKALCQAHVLSTLGPKSIVKMSNEELRVAGEQTKGSGTESASAKLTLPEHVRS
jgi:hypothetical protein